MKKLFILVVLAAFGLSTALYAQSSKKQTVTIKTNACSSKSDEIFKEIIPFLKGVSSYEFCEHSGNLTVTYNPKRTDEATIRKAIAKLGFDADDVKGDPVARKKLPQECLTPVKKGSCKHSCGEH